MGKYINRITEIDSCTELDVSRETKLIFKHNTVCRNFDLFNKRANNV